MVKLGEQIQEISPQQRATRTERLIQQRRGRFTEAEKSQEFEKLKQEAKTLQEERFSKVQNLDEYELEYNKLRPELKQFFHSPSSLRAEKETSITNSVQRANARIILLKREIEEQRKTLQEGNTEGRGGIWRENQVRKLARKEEELYQLQQNISKIREGVSYSDVRTYAIEKTREKEYLDQLKLSYIKPKYTTDYINQRLKQIYQQALNVYGDTEKARRWTESQSTRFTESGKPIPITLEKREPTPEEIAKFEAEQKAIQKKGMEDAREYLKQYGLTEEIATAEAPKEKKGILKTIKNTYLSILGTMPFGLSDDVPLPDKLHEEKQKSVLKQDLGFDIIRDESYGKALAKEQRKEAERGYQVKLIEDFSKAVEEAPEEQKYYVQEAGLEILGKRKGEFYITPVVTEETIEFKSNVLEPSKTFHEWAYIKAEKEGNQKALSNLKIKKFSREAFKTYFTIKGLGYVVKGLGYVAKGTYGALGGGLKISSSGVVIPKTTSTFSKLIQFEAKGITKGSVLPLFQGISTYGKPVLQTTAIAGVGGVYAYGEYKQYKYFTERFGKETGKGLFLPAFAGRLTGLGLVVGESAYKGYQTKQFNKRMEKINYLKEARAEELKLIKQRVDIGTGTSQGRGKLSYHEVGKGKEVLSKSAQKEIAEQYSQFSGISKKQAVTKIRELGIYKQTFKVKSNIPRYEKLIKELRTGKYIKTRPSDIYTIRRFGLIGLEKGSKGSSKAFALEFSKKGSKISNILLKTTYAKDKYAITGIWKRGVYSPKLDLRGFRLQKIITTKLSKVSAEKIGEVKIQTFTLDNRLVKQALGERVNIKDIIKLMKSEGSVKDIKNLYDVSGRTSQFTGIRAKAPNYRWIKVPYGEIKVKSGYKYYQGGVGQQDIPIKNIIAKLEKAGYFKTQTSLISRKMKPFESSGDVGQKAVKEAIKGLPSQSQQQTQQVFKTTFSKLSTKQFTKSASESIISPVINVKTNLATKLHGGTQQALGGGLVYGGIKELLRNRMVTSNRTMQRLINETDVLEKQSLVPRQTQKLSSALKTQLKQLTVSPRSITPITPTIPSPRTPKPPKPPIPKFIPFIWFTPDIVREINRRINKKRKFTEFAYLPDFTSRIIGLKPEVITSKQAKNLIKRQLSGLEIRTPVIIRDKIKSNIRRK